MTPTLNAIGIVVQDLSASLAFYRLLGLEAGSDHDGGHAEAQVAGIRVMWDTVANIASFDDDWTPPSGSPAMTMAFDCGSPHGVDDAVAKLRDAGHQVKKEPWDAFWGQRYASVLDPDGHQVDLFAASA